MRELTIQTAIQASPHDMFEKFAIQLIERALFPGLNFTSLSHDLGEDARSEQSTIWLLNGRRVSAFASHTATITKIKADCRRCKETGREIEHIVFATSKEIRKYT